MMMMMLMMEHEILSWIEKKGKAKDKGNNVSSPSVINMINMGVIEV